MIRQYIPRTWAMAVCYPFFWFLERESKDSEYTMRYLGDGDFELVASESERELGRGEAYISMLPLSWYVTPVVLALMLTPDTLAGAGLTTVSCIPLLLSLGAINEVTIQQVQA